MTNDCVWISALGCAAALPLGAAARPADSGEAPAGRRPHIILLMADQHRFDAMGAVDGRVVTPALDALAADGVLFTSGYSSAPSSTPARAGLLTGLTPWHHGMLGYNVVAREYPFEMPRMLREAGYFTFGIGKMHWSPQRSLHGFHGTLLDESGRCEDEGFISDYRQWFMTQAPGADPDLTGVGWNDHRGAVYALPEELHPTVWTADEACGLLEHYDPEGAPLFLKVSFARPHSPYDPPQRWYDRYEGRDVALPCVGDWCDDRGGVKDPAAAAADAAYGNFGDDYACEVRRHYYASVSFLDEQIARVVEALKRKGMYDNALIFYVSDHGDMLGDHHHWRKTYPYEGSTHVPFIVKWPAAAGIAPQRCATAVELRDVLPTMLEAAGAEIPEALDGVALTRVVRGELRGRCIEMEHATCYSADNYWFAVTDGRYKYVWNFHTGREQLFDLAADPGEEHDASGDRRCRRELERLRAVAVERLAERGEGFVRDGLPAVRTETMLRSPNYPSGGAKR